jgi:hypothetical protein
MFSVKWRLILVVVLAVVFLSWIGYLGVLAFTTRHPIVLSRPQLLAADLIVVGHVESLDRPVAVGEVVWPQSPEAQGLEGHSIPVANLKACQADWVGPGWYIVPLGIKKGGAEEKFEVAVQGQRMPGYEPGFDQGKKTTWPPRIYPATPQTRAQVEQVLKP